MISDLERRLFADFDTQRNSWGPGEWGTFQAAVRRLAEDLPANPPPEGEPVDIDDAGPWAPPPFYLGWASVGYEPPKT